MKPSASKPPRAVAAGAGARRKRTQVVDTNGTTTFTYDALYRLTGADYPVTADDSTYTYDALGNRRSHVKNGIPTTAN